MDNPNYLRERFLQRLIGLRPQSVLDVGCGGGFLLRGCQVEGIPAAGLETDSELVGRLERERLQVFAGTAEELPFEDNQFAWVAMRHSLHHCTDPARALAEAARVARTGLLIAEPWFDRRFPEQALASDLTEWAKRQDRRMGRVHHTDHGPEQILALLPDGIVREAEFDCFLRPAHVEAQEVETTFAECLEGLPEDHPDRAEAEALRARARTTPVGVNGSVTVMIRLRS